MNKKEGFNISLPDYRAINSPKSQRQNKVEPIDDVEDAKQIKKDTADHSFIKRKTTKLEYYLSDHTD